MTWAYVAVGAGTLISGYLGSQSSKKAANAAQAGSAEAIAEARRQFDLVRGDTADLRALNSGASARLSRLYGFAPAPTGGAGGYSSGTPFSTTLPRATVPGGSSNIGGSLVQKLGGAAYAFDPAAALFGSKHGDERRNLKAFLADNQVMDLGNGTLALPDGRTFTKDQLQAVAGAYYGARYHPDGNQAEWQQRYDSMLTAAPQQPTGSPGTAAAPSGPDMSAFFESPDYQFNLAEGQKAIDRSASARGGLLSGGAIKEGTRYASNLASREYGGFVDRLLAAAGLGTSGINTSASAGANTASIVGSAATNAGNARGSAYLMGGNAINNSVQGGISNLLLAKYLGG